MRLIFEHPWISSFLVLSIGFGFFWAGLRDGLVRHVKIGVFVMCVSGVILITGILVVTPTEHAQTAISGFVEAVADGNESSALTYLTDDVIIVDDWKQVNASGRAAVKESIKELHRRHSITYNSIIRFQPIERDVDVLVELTILSRVSGIGTVPSRWRILVKDDGPTWRIYSIDAIEIMGRSFR
ncbi:MAG: hypothetical protein QF718_07190 [Phycisphaerales bacterium]|jgi:hypothetical protein|nr:hypothetical protein [Phycisphaerales bacterium]